MCFYSKLSLWQALGLGPVEPPMKILIKSQCFLLFSRKHVCLLCAQHPRLLCRRDEEPDHQQQFHIKWCNVWSQDRRNDKRYFRRCSSSGVWAELCPVLDPSGASLGTKQRPQKVQREDTDSLTDIDLHSLFSSLSDFSKNLKGKWSEIAFLHQGLKLRNPELPQGRSKWFNNGRMSRRLSSSVRT